MKTKETTNFSHRQAHKLEREPQQAAKEFLNHVGGLKKFKGKNIQMLEKNFLTVFNNSVNRKESVRKLIAEGNHTKIRDSELVFGAQIRFFLNNYKKVLNGRTDISSVCSSVKAFLEKNGFTEEKFFINTDLPWKNFSEMRDGLLENRNLFIKNYNEETAPQFLIVPLIRIGKRLMELDISIENKRIDELNNHYREMPVDEIKKDLERRRREGEPGINKHVTEEVLKKQAYLARLLKELSEEHEKLGKNGIMDKVKKLLQTDPLGRYLIKRVFEQIKRNKTEKNVEKLKEMAGKKSPAQMNSALKRLVSLGTIDEKSREIVLSFIKEEIIKKFRKTPLTDIEKYLHDEMKKGKISREMIQEILGIKAENEMGKLEKLSPENAEKAVKYKILHFVWRKELAETALVYLTAIHPEKNWNALKTFIEERNDVWELSEAGSQNAEKIVMGRISKGWKKELAVMSLGYLKRVYPEKNWSKLEEIIKKTYQTKLS